MGKLIPRCFATNNDTIYFLARAVRTNDKTEQELVALVRSDPYPTSIQEARWTVVSTSTSGKFSEWYERYYGAGDLSCSVDDNGVFIFTGPYSNNERRSYRFDPQALKSDYYETFPKNTTGEWAALVLSFGSRYFPRTYNPSSPEPFLLFSVNEASSTHNDTSTGLVQGANSKQFMVQYKFMGQKNVDYVDSSPMIEYATIGASGYTNNYKSSNLTTNTNGTVLSIRYRNEKLWVVMETGTPYYGHINNYTYARYHRTLAVFPFTAPYNLSSPPVSIATTPWDLTCEENEIQTWGAFGDKIYFSCRSGDWAAHLYTYDSATNETQGPVETDRSCTGKRSLTLVPGKPGSLSPAFGLVSDSTSFGVLDLRLENYGRCTRFESDGKSLFLVDETVEAPKPDPPECLESCTEWKAMKALIGGVAGAIAALVICCCLMAWYCSKKRQREREPVFVAVGADEVVLETIEKQQQQQQHSPHE
ncbi:hypothetical protein BGZ81_011072 [Podila clonocystis]|nr:hypothetical protein BGZ81_011072 [Podila clonocystis]